MNNNDAIIQRIKGVPAQKNTLKDKFDPRNPNKPEANDNDSAQTPTLTLDQLPLDGGGR